MSDKLYPRLRDYEAPAREILDQMSIREKATFAVGKDFWHLHEFEKYGLPSVLTTDGPHGLRKQNEGAGSTDLANTIPSTAFPTASATACSFDTELLYEMGQAIGEECIKEECAVILGPGANHKRSPLCGRNFEYFSEDPVLSGEIGAALTNGIEDKGIGTSIKHYACNSQEKARMNNDSIVDERALHEIYLRQYETIVKKAQPTTIMVSYNRLNGTFASDSRYLMKDIARDKWGYEGLFITDWGAVNKLAEGYENGLDIEMPGLPQDRIKAITEGVLDGTVSIERVNESALLNIEMLLRYKDAVAGKFNNNRTGAAAADMDAHAEVARKVAEGSAVLLKNEDNLLPLKKGATIAVFGNFAEKPRYQGAGSSQLIPHKLITPLEAFQASGISVEYSEGYGFEETMADQDKINAAVSIAKTADVCVVFAGLPASFESEGFDRSKLDMPESHNELIAQVAEANPNTVVVLQTGSPVLMPWLGKVKAVLCAYLAGSSNGSAIVNLLTGTANPSGRLAETFPLQLEDNPSYGEYGNDPFFTVYKESIFTGYRYYDAAGKNVLFPFGYGLSYTTFGYSNLRVQKVPGTAASAVGTEFGEGDIIKVSVDVTNTGSVAGKEVVQVYVGQKNPVIFKPKKELKAFTKVALEPGETKTVTFDLTSSAFNYWNVNLHDWHVAAGDYTISVCRNVNEPVLSETVTLAPSTDAEVPDYRASAPEYYDLSTKWVAKDIPLHTFEKLYGMPVVLRHIGKPYGLNSTFSELAGGRIVKAMKFVMGLLPIDTENSTFGMMDAMLPDMPLKVARMGGLNNRLILAIADIFNANPTGIVKNLLGKK